jgi:hypothetical protein
MAVSKRRQFSTEKGICHISEDTIAKLPDPSGNSPDPLTDVIRSGARRLIEQAIEAELATLLAAFDSVAQIGLWPRFPYPHLKGVSTGDFSGEAPNAMSERAGRTWPPCWGRPPKACRLRPSRG